MPYVPDTLAHICAQVSRDEWYGIKLTSCFIANTIFIFLPRELVFNQYLKSEMVLRLYVCMFFWNGERQSYRILIFKK